MTAMLTIQRRHSRKCPDRNKGPDYLKCRGRCPLRLSGMVGGRRIRKSLKTRDLRRAARRLAQMEEASVARPRKPVTEAIAAFHAQHEKKADETKRKYRRILGHLNEYCAHESYHYLDQMTLESLDKYAIGRESKSWTWIKEIEILRQFFGFCIDREWTTRNPAKNLVRPKLLEANDEVPYTLEEIRRIITACDFFGRGEYERLRARAMVLLMRFAGLRVSDVVTLGEEHIHGKYLVKHGKYHLKRAQKNGRLIRVELPDEVHHALAKLPRPRAAAQDCRLFFSSGNASLRSLVKGAQRTLAAVFKYAKVEGAHPHRFRHTLASEILGKGGTIEDAAAILGDTPATIRRHYAKWTPEYQARQDRLMRKIRGTNLAQAKEEAATC